METTYNAAADSYDHPANTFWDRYGRRTVDRLRLRRGDRVLDVCCGSGASALPAAEAVGSQPLAAAEEWWPMVLGTGYRGTIERLAAESREQVRRDCLGFIRANQVRAVEANVVYALATRASVEPQQ